MNCYLLSLSSSSSSSSSSLLPSFLRKPRSDMYRRTRTMTKIHPNAHTNPNPPASRNDRENGDNNKLAVAAASSSEISNNGSVTVLTVWRKSLLFNCNGYTVFDDKGNLVFRVDNYMAANKAEVVLMDAAGKALFTIRRKKLSLGDTWLVYDGEASAGNLRFSVRKHASLLNGKSLAHISDASGKNGCGRIVYQIEGTYARRSCAILDVENKKTVAEIKQKETVGGVGFGMDVFRLIVQPEMETPVAMAIVILLDQMFGSSSRRRASA